ncbi:MAG: C4-dicarboxylic acid transporter DauA [Planctomycetes bacterium]|nr:C4-dicarboxylic acid transporter DauA [Planctomycetota bacterium]
MPRRDSETAIEGSVLARLGCALRVSLASGYGARDLRTDILAGLVVGVVALPLAMALAIASGVPPQHGLYTSIIAGALIAVCGGSRVSVSGPTAAFVVLLVPVSARFGVGGLLIASMMAGVMLCLMGIARLGKLIQFIPHPVTTGFTAGIGVVIAGLQLKDFFGLRPETNPEHFTDKLVAYVHAYPTIHHWELVVGAFTLFLLLVWPRITKKIPAPLVAVGIATLVSYWLAHTVDGFEVATIGSRFGGIPRAAPALAWPWDYPGPDGQPIGLSLDTLRALMSPAVAIAVLGAIESLLCAVVADGMAGTRHDSDVELVAQGLGNVVAPLFGGFAATGAIARTTTGIRAGARSPISAITHALFVLVAVLALAPLLYWLPMAALAAMLMLVAWHMSDARHFVHVLRVAPKGDVAVLLTCFFLTVIFDMTIAVGVGVVLAAFFFMNRMSEMFQAAPAQSPHEQMKDPTLVGVVVYSIRGPLFFGAAEKAVGALTRVQSKTRAVILQMDGVPVMDVTGLVALESALARLRKARVFVAISGVQPQPRQILEKAGIHDDSTWISVCSTGEEALASVRAHLARDAAGG